MGISEKIGRFKNAFHAGPEWFRPAVLERKTTYRSPTLLISVWIYGWFIRILTVPGRFLLPMALIIAPYSTISINSPVRALTMLLAVIFLADFLVGWGWRPRLQIFRNIPDRVRAGSDIPVEYLIRNNRNCTAWDIVIDPFPLQVGLAWLQTAAVAAIAPKAEIRLHSTIAASRRGKYLIYSPIADSTFPLGLIKRSVRAKGNFSELLIHPAYEPLNMLDLPLGKKLQREGDSLIAKIGESMDFSGCRDFRDGDDPRHIDWPGSARHGELIVMEYQDDFLTRAALITDTFIVKKKKFLSFSSSTRDYFPELEASLSLSAALVEFLIKKDFVIDIFIAGSEVYHFKAGRSLSGLDQILDVMACVVPGRKSPGKAMTPAVLEEITGLGCAVLVLLQWDEERRELVKVLREHGIALKILLISDDPQMSCPEEAVLLRSQDIMEGKITSL